LLVKMEEEEAAFENPMELIPLINDSKKEGR
jgi:hypothetical protein